MNHGAAWAAVLPRTWGEALELRLERDGGVLRLDSQNRVTSQTLGHARGPGEVAATLRSLADAIEREVAPSTRGAFPCRCGDAVAKDDTRPCYRDAGHPEPCAPACPYGACDQADGHAGGCT